MDLEIFKSDSLRKALWSAKITKIGHLIHEGGWISAEALALRMSMRSVRVAERLLTQINDILPVEHLDLEASDMDASAFPELTFSIDTGEWKEMEGGLLFIRSSQSNLFSDAGKKDLYALCVKAVHFHMLENLRESKWLDVFGSGVSPKGCWRTLYKPPIEKRSGDLQWRVVHGIIATNRHRAHIDPQVGEECPFCEVQETVFHLFLNCSRLQLFLRQLEGYCQILGEVFTPMLFIYGPKYSRSKMKVHVL